MSTEALLTVLDLVGLFVFALSGASAAVAKKLDVFGVVVLGLVAATGGGAMRDVLLGVAPPLVLSDWRYLAVPAVASVLTFYSIRSWPGCAGWCCCRTPPAWRCSSWPVRARRWTAVCRR